MAKRFIVALTTLTLQVGVFRAVSRGDVTPDVEGLLEERVLNTLADDTGGVGEGEDVPIAHNSVINVPTSSDSTKRLFVPSEKKGPIPSSLSQTQCTLTFWTTKKKGQLKKLFKKSPKLCYC